MPKVKRVIGFKEVTPYETFVVCEVGFQNVTVFATTEIFGRTMFIHNDVEAKNGIAVTDPYSRLKLSHDIKTAGNKDVMGVLERIWEKIDVAFKNKAEFDAMCELGYQKVQERIISYINNQRSLALEVCVLF